MRAKDKNKDPIPGCAITQNVNALEESPTCACAAGRENEGCEGAKTDTDHQLLCTHLRAKVLASQRLWQLFTPGGLCSVDSQATLNRPLLHPGQPYDFSLPGEEASSLSLLAGNLMAPQWLVAREKRSRCGKPCGLP